MDNVLVTGCGGDIGQSICKILRDWPLISTIVGCDIHNDHPGKFLCDKVFVVPRCTSGDYEREMKSVIAKNSISFVISASEPELRYFLQSDISKSFLGIPVIMANSFALQVGFDKMLTAEFLKKNNLVFPVTTLANDPTHPTWPAIFKSRSGSGSKQILKLQNQSDFDFYSRKYPDFIVQEYLDDRNGEFTCGLFRSKSGIIRTIIFKRTLSGGFSNYGEVVYNDAITSLLEKMAAMLHLEGSINVQLRLTDKGPVVFEINPRFSSTVYFRHLLGFKDLLWSVEDQLNLGLSSYTNVPEGKKFYKGYHEYYE